jgi:transcriptional regulator with GAF, ATPase, and Fis domain/predicted Ser/Thr protein kinase
MGEVYLALTPSKERVAVKALRTAASPSLLEKEVRLLVGLRHPHIVSILGCAAKSDSIFGEDRGPCYWMEYVEGENVLDAARKADPGKILGWLVQTLDALDYLHGQGVLHGDLSPRNLIVDAKGQLKLLDFGLASVLEESLGVEAATVPYLAPERLSGIHTPAGDLFSLGTVFYEALSGRHPRAGAKGLHEMTSLAAPPLDLGKAHAIEARAVDGMIETDLARRFSRAADVLEALRGRTPEAPRKTAEYHSLAFWGGEDALRRLRAAMEGIREKTAVFALHGATGVGKRRFLREAAFQAALAGIPVLERFDGRFQDLHPDGATFFRSLETLSLPELSKLLGLRRAGFPEKGALILLEWNEDFVDEAVRPFFSHLVRWPEVEEIHLKNLDRSDALSLLRAGLGDGLTPERADALFLQTGGNPKLLVEAVGRLRAGAEGLDLEAAGSWREHFLWKVLALSEEEKEVLAFAAAGDTVAADRLIGVLGGQGRLIPRLAERGLLRSDRPGSYRLALPLLQDVLDEVLSPAEWASAHRRWLTALKTAPLSDPQRLHHALALKDEAEATKAARPVADLLWERGERRKSLDLIGRSLEVVADREEKARLWKEKMSLLADLGRYEEALAAADSWFALGPDNDPMPLKTVKYWLFSGLYHGELGHAEEARERLSRALRAGDEGDPQHAPFLVRALAQSGVLELRRGDRAAARAHLEKALALAGPSASGGGRRRAEILRNLAEVSAAEKDGARALELLEEARALYAGDGFDPGVFACRLQEGNLALDRDDPAAAERAYAEADAIAERLDSDRLLASVRNNRAVLARKTGRLGEALKLLPKAIEVFEMLGLRKELEECRSNLALTREALGRTEDLPAAFKAPSTESKSKESPMTTPTQFPFAWEQALERLSGLARELLRESDTDIVLRRLMDSAMELANARQGFLLLRADEPEGPVPGFAVAVARNVNRETLKTQEYALSLSAVRQAMATGEAVVADNALQDARFRDAASVHLKQLKSILALPINGPAGILGVFYLDHPLAEGLFQGEVLQVLRFFAELAGLALEKGRMIAELRRSNEDLSHKVDEQGTQMERLEQEVKESRLKLKNEYSEIVGRSPKMVEVLSLVDKVTDSRIPVWIYGESGTGKEAIARALHFNSARKNHPFVTENCSALPESLLESELFGHKKGAFTHATSDKKGLLHYADKGTIFLDEIADMSLSLQAKLLRFLQEGEIRPIGSPQVVKVDVRVVSASNKDLRKLVAEGKFREDLFFRLNGITVKLPPLRERREDLPLLSEHFLKGRASLSPEALRLFMAYDWPGNVRELQQVLETAVLFAEGAAGAETITRKSLQFKDAFSGGGLKPVLSSPPAAGKEAKPLAPDLERILRAIRDQAYHKGNAAKALGMSRRHLYTKLEGYGVPAESQKLKEFIDRNLGAA